MQREIRFRAWDKKEKLMVSHLDPRGLNLSGDDIASYAPECVWMQFTGLHDKNGKEIYEGDVIVVEDEETDIIDPLIGGPHYTSNHLLPVEFLGAQFGVAVTERKNVVSIGWIGLKQLIEDYGEFEVIGNIYENPELLK